MTSAETWGGSGDPLIARSAALARATAADAALRPVTRTSTRPVGLAALARPLPGLAAGLRDEADAADLDPALDALDHVVDREGGDRRGGHRLHLDAGLGRRGRLGADAQDARRSIGRDAHDEVGQWQRVAQRDELRGALAAHDARELRHGQDVALGAASVDDEAERFGRDRDLGFGDGA